VVRREPFHEVVQERDHSAPAGWVDSSGHHEHDPHAPSLPAPSRCRDTSGHVGTRRDAPAGVTTIRPITTERRAQQRQFVDTVVDRLRGGDRPLPPLDGAALRFAGLATGLTALAAHLTDDGATAGAGVVDPEVGDWLAEQRTEVARRVDRFRELVPRVRSILADAAVPAVAVKGAALAASAQPVWEVAEARPMADIDLVVPRRYRAQASAALQRGGLRHRTSSSHEDVFLAWGDGGVGRTDGESAAHNGRVEVHPDWAEFLHGYVARGFDVEAHWAPDPDLPGGFRLGLAPLTANVLGHLASTVVRAEVRAVNAVDLWWCDRAGVDWDEVAGLCRTLDPRLTAPGLWLAHALLPGSVSVRLLATEFDRLPRAARRALDAVAPEDVFRDPDTRTASAWRQAFAGGAERLAVLDQMAFPTGSRGLRPLLARVPLVAVRGRA
jgi:hypothetical protein